VAWIIPKKNRYHLVVWVSREGYRGASWALEDRGPVPVPMGAPHALDEERDRLVYGDGGRIFVLEGLLAGSPRLRSLRISWSSVITALRLEGDLVYVGGRGFLRVLLGVVTLGEVLRWEPMELPIEVGVPGKEVDGFALEGRRLIVVDDRVFPWYFLVYDVTEGHRPRPLEARMFHGRVTSVASTSGLLALRQVMRAPGRMVLDQAVKRQVKLFELPSLEELGVLEGHEGAPEWEDAPGIPGVGFAEGKLLVAQGERGLGVLSLEGLGSSSQPGARLEGLAKQEARIPVPGGPVVGVLPAAAGHAFAVIRGPAGLDSVWVAHGLVEGSSGGSVPAAGGEGAAPTNLGGAQW
jgi:hypothetical protein